MADAIVLRCERETNIFPGLISAIEAAVLPRKDISGFPSSLLFISISLKLVLLFHPVPIALKKSFFYRKTSCIMFILIGFFFRNTQFLFLKIPIP